MNPDAPGARRWDKATFAQLHALSVVSESQTLTQAARSLGVKQPTLSGLIATLEQTLDVPLIRRSHHGVSLTPAGRELVEGTHGPLLQIREQLRATSEIGQRYPRGVLCPGVPAVVMEQAAKCLPIGLGNIDWSVAPSAQHSQKLVAGSASVSIGRSYSEGAELIGRLPLGVVVAEHSRLAGGGPLALEELSGHVLAWFEESDAPEYARRLAQWMHSTGLCCERRVLPPQSTILAACLRTDERLFLLRPQFEFPEFVWRPLRQAPEDIFWLAGELVVGRTR